MTEKHNTSLLFNKASSFMKEHNTSERNISISCMATFYLFKGKLSFVLLLPQIYYSHGSHLCTQHINSADFRLFHKPALSLLCPAVWLCLLSGFFTLTSFFFYYFLSLSLAFTRSSFPEKKGWSMLQVILDSFFETSDPIFPNWYNNYLKLFVWGRMCGLLYTFFSTSSQADFQCLMCAPVNNGRQAESGPVVLFPLCTHVDL